MSHLPVAGFCRGDRVKLAETCQLVLFDPTLLSCAKKRGVEPPRRSCFLRWRVNTQGSADPCAIPWVLGMQCLTNEIIFCGFRKHSLSGLQLQSGMQYVQRSDCRAANLQSFAAARHFCSAKILAGGLRWGWGPQRSRQRHRQRKEISRGNLLCAASGPTNLSYPPTSNHSKVRNNARLVTCPCRAAPGCQRDRGPSVSGSVQRNPFQGVPLGNFFAEARHRASLRS